MMKSAANWIGGGVYKQIDDDQLMDRLREVS